MPQPITRAAASVLVVRDGDGGIEVLMVRRDQGMKFMGGYWVFPGGAVDAADAVEGGDELGAACRAAVRETAEEAGLALEDDALVAWSHWEPPPDVAKRFATWFFVAPAPDAAVVIDDVEVRAFAWWRPAAVLEARDRGEVELAPPTWVNLWELAHHATVDEVLAYARGRTPEYFITKIAPHPGGAVAMWFGDEGYATDDPTIAGPRHRLWMSDEGWRYERDGPQ